MSILRHFSLFCAIFILWQGYAYGQNTKVQEGKRARLEREIAILDNQLKKNEAKSTNVLNSIELIKKKISDRKELVEESDKEIRSLNNNITNKNREINDLQQRLDTLSLYYARLVKSAYKNRDAKIWYMYIIASQNMGQAFRRYGYLRDLSTQMNNQAQKIKSTRKELETEKTKLSGLKKNAQTLRSERMKELTKLKLEEAESKQLVAKLQKDRNKYQKDLNTKKNQVEALNREIAKIIREAIALQKAKAAKENKKKGTAKAKSKDIDYKLSEEFLSNKGKLTWPAEGPVVEHFGQHNHPVFTKVKMPFNNGISITLPPSTTIKSVFRGVVKQIVVMPGYNQCVLIQHGEYFTFYCKLENITVKQGDIVQAKQAIGTVGTINGDTQLHFQIWAERNPQNPEFWLKR